MFKRKLCGYLERCLNKKLSRLLVCGDDIRFRRGASCMNGGNPSNIYIGNHGIIGGGLQALYGGKIKIGDNIFIGTNTIIQAKENVSIGNNVIISTNVLIVDNNNHPTDPEMRIRMSSCNDYMTDELWTWKYADSKSIVIEDNVWICRNTFILKGVTVGEGSIVALGAVVTKDVPPYTIVAGNPAKVVRELKELRRK